MKKKIRLLALVMTSLTLLNGCGKKDEETLATTQETAMVTAVEVMEAQPNEISKTLTYIGKVTSNNSVNVTSKISGQAKEVLVDVGDQVKKGQTLLILDDTDYKNQIRTTEAQLKISDAGVNSAQTGLSQVNDGGQTQTQLLSMETAVKNAQINVDNSKITLENAQNAFADTEKKYNDYKTMLAAGVIAQKDFDAVELGYTQAQNSVNQAQLAYNSAVTTLSQAQESLQLYNEKTLQDSVENAQNGVATAVASRDAVVAQLNVLKDNLNYIEVKSPIDGVVTARNIEPTNMVSAAQPPFVIAEISTVTVDVEVSEKIINLINVGQKIDLNINAVYDEPVQGTIRQINPTAGASGAFLVRIEVDNKDGKLKPGMVAHVSFVEEQATNAIVVPRNTVIESDNKCYVFVVDGNKAVKKEVTTGVDNGENIEIMGINAGESIVITGQNYLSDGSAVNVASKEA